MIATYKARQGQSIYDICLQTYGDIKYLFTKLIPDNNLSVTNTSGYQGQSIIFDTDYIADNSLYNRNQDEDIFYVTGKVVTGQTPSGGLQTDDGIDITTDDGIQITVD